MVHQFIPKFSPPAIREARKISVPVRARKIEKPPCKATNEPSTSHVQTPPQKMPAKIKGPGWDPKIVRYDMYNKYCQSVLTSVKIFMKADQSQQSNFPSQPSQPIPSSQEVSQQPPALNTTLTQAVHDMGVTTEESPEGIYQRHSNFEFQPIMESPEVVVQEEDEEIFFDAADESIIIEDANQRPPYSAENVVVERLSHFHGDLENFIRR